VLEPSGPNPNVGFPSTQEPDGRGGKVINQIRGKLKLVSRFPRLSKSRAICSLAVVDLVTLAVGLALASGWVLFSNFRGFSEEAPWSLWPHFAIDLLGVWFSVRLIERILTNNKRRELRRKWNRTSNLINARIAETCDTIAQLLRPKSVASSGIFIRLGGIHIYCRCDLRCLREKAMREAWAREFGRDLLRARSSSRSRRLVRLRRAMRTVRVELQRSLELGAHTLSPRTWETFLSTIRRLSAIEALLTDDNLGDFVGDPDRFTGYYAMLLGTICRLWELAVSRADSMDGFERRLRASGLTSS
jgi:hypothetical protein